MQQEGQSLETTDRDGPLEFHELWKRLLQCDGTELGWAL
jgi:hypothetical protein